MIQEKIGNMDVVRYSDIDDLVITNYNLFNEYSLLEAEIGGMDAVDKHFRNLDVFLTQKKFDQAVQERKNLHQTFFHLLQRNNFPALQWAVMVKSVDGVDLKDYSLDAMKRLIEQLSANGLTQGKVKQDVEDAKKKSALN